MAKLSPQEKLDRTRALLSAPPRVEIMYLPEAVHSGTSTFYPGLVDVSVYPKLKKYCVSSREFSEVPDSLTEVEPGVFVVGERPKVQPRPDEIGYT